MFYDSITLVEGSQFFNLTVATGASFPLSPTAGEMVYLTSGTVGLYVYDGTQWVRVGDANDMSSHVSDLTIHLTSGQNTFLDAITVTAAEVNYLAGVSSAIQTQLNAITSTASTHNSNEDLHLTSGQNTFLDGVTASSNEVNYLTGTTSSVQTQLGAKLNLAGGSMTGNIIIPATNYVSIADAPSSALHAANKTYVDSLVSGITWQNPIRDPDLKDDTLNTPPVTSTDELYIIGATPTGAWVGMAGHAVFWNGASWVDLLSRAVIIGDRFGVSIEHGGVPAGGLTGKLDNLVEITNATPGAITYTFTPPVANLAVFVSQPTSPHYGHGYTYVASSAAWVEFSGPSATPAGVGLSYSGNVLNVNLGAGIAQLPSDEVGVDVYSTGGLMTTVDGTASSTATAAQLSLTKVGTAGTYKSVTADAYGRITAGTNPTTLSGYGITDAASIAQLHYVGTTSIAANRASGAQTLTGVSIDGTAGIANALNTGNNYQMGSIGVGTGASGTVGEIRATNNITAYYSDARLKTVSGNIQNALAKVCTLNGVLYTGNDVAKSVGYAGNEVQVGVLAQEVKAVQPEVVTAAPFDIGQNADGTEFSKSGQDYMTVRYERLVPLLIEAIKELKAEIDVLKSK